MPSAEIKQLAENLWIKRYPLSVLGTEHGRTVTILRLSSGKVIVHSMAPFSAADLAEIRRVGEPTWLVEAMMLHDTYAREGKNAFPDAIFLAPSGFGGVVNFPTSPLVPPPAEWVSELDVIELQGAPRLKEHVFIHRSSRTLIVADLVFNFRPDERGWNRFFHRHIVGLTRYPGVSRIFRMCIANREAFRASLDAMLKTDFDRVIVGHGEVIESAGKAALRRALTDARLL
jgi:hypothetical protein